MREPTGYILTATHLGERFYYIHHVRPELRSSTTMASRASVLTLSQAHDIKESGSKGFPPGAWEIEPA